MNSPWRLVAPFVIAACGTTTNHPAEDIISPVADGGSGADASGAPIVTTAEDGGVSTTEDGGPRSSVPLDTAERTCAPPVPAGRPRLAVSSEGNAIVLVTGEDRSLWACIYDVYTGWRAPSRVAEQLVPAAVQDARAYPDVAFVSPRQALVAWPETRNGAAFARASYVDLDRDIAPAVDLGEAYASSYVRLAASEDSRTGVAVWEGPPSSALIARIFQGGSRTWSAPKPFTGLQASLQASLGGEPSARLNAAGDIAITYPISNGFLHVGHMFFDRVAGWSSAAERVDAQQEDGPGVTYPMGALDAEGHALVVYIDATAGGAMMRTRPRGGPWSTAKALFSDNRLYRTEGAVAWGVDSWAVVISDLVAGQRRMLAWSGSTFPAPALESGTLIRLEPPMGARPVQAYLSSGTSLYARTLSAATWQPAVSFATVGAREIGSSPDATLLLWVQSGSVRVRWVARP